jgi:hypothetical protein
LDTTMRLQQLCTDKIGGILAVVMMIIDANEMGTPFLTLLIAAPSVVTINEVGVILDDIWYESVLASFHLDMAQTKVNCPVYLNMAQTKKVNCPVLGA